MGKPRILVIDGNRAATREQQVAAGGQRSGEGYVSVLQRLAPLDCDIVRPADGAVQFPAGVSLADYDGVAITGSALNIYDGGAHIERQIELTRAVLRQRRAVLRQLLGHAGGGDRSWRARAAKSARTRIRFCTPHRPDRGGPPASDVPGEAGGL